MAHLNFNTTIEDEALRNELRARLIMRSLKRMREGKEHGRMTRLQDIDPALYKWALRNVSDQDLDELLKFLPES